MNGPLNSETEVKAFGRAAYAQIYDEMREKDRYALELGDTLDVKASILLAAITLIATQTVYFFEKTGSRFQHVLLIGSAVLIVGAIAAAFGVLWPRTYQLPVAETSAIDRTKELQAFYAQNEGRDSAEMLGELTKDMMGWAEERIGDNMRNNFSKKDFMQWAFYFTGAAIVLNSVVLFTFVSF
jgi:hypothetical protein